jgi:hypothetical protein
MVLAWVCDGRGHQYLSVIPWQQLYNPKLRFTL